MSHLKFRGLRWIGVLATTVALCAPALAADVELLPNNLLTPTSKEQTKPGQFKKAGPWRVGVSFGGVGNTWIVQMIQEMRHAAAQDKNIGEFIFVEANWQAAKQVADVEDLLTKKVDVLIVGPISSAIGAPLVEKAAKTGIPVVVFGAFGKAMNSTVELMGAGEVFGRQGGEYLRKELDGKGNVWAFRGVAGVEEETLRYNGFRKSIEGSSMKVTKEVFGDWNYAKSKPLVPMTGEGNNGFLRVWKATGVKSVAPQFTPGLGAAMVRAAAALLDGKPLYRSYFSSPPAITQADLDKFYRPDLNDAYWLPSTLPEPTLKELFRR